MSFLFDTFRPSNKNFLDSFYESSKENRAFDGFKWASSALKSVVNADNSTGSAKTLRPADSDTSFHTANTSPGSQNSIQKSSGSSYASTSSSPKQGTPRKSLTAKYLEAKASEKKDTSLEIISESDASPQPVNVNTILPDLRELPDTSYFNHTLSFYNKDDAGSTTSEDSLEIINDPQEEKLLAPIRQSLLHLVAEEDVPEILEAMAENVSKAQRFLA
uniref:PABC domain-containing protein n=1 Tax=Bursaphelenchus xylophilus TaxID=6326 RepID=A0A1I7SB55_BURXY